MTLVLSRAELIKAPGPHQLVFFWGHTQKTPGVVDKSCLSQWWPVRFTVDGVEYKSAEAFMMAGKARLFGDADALAKIIAADDPAQVKALGREVRNFDAEKWAQARFDVVVAGNIAKFGQHPELKAFLLGTGDAVIVEAAPRDTIWGIGLGAENPKAQDPRTWRGENLLGFALMKARAALR